MAYKRTENYAEARVASPARGRGKTHLTRHNFSLGMEINVTALTGRQSPDDIALAPSGRTAARVKLGIDALQSGEIEAGGQSLRNKLAYELLHHARMRKEPVIQRVRVRHR